MPDRPTIIPVATDGPAVAAFTTRYGGISRGDHSTCNLGWGTGDRAGDVSGNRRIVCAALGLDPARVSCGTQVHGVDIRTVDDDRDPPFDRTLTGWPEGDGLLSRRPRRGLVVLAADCLPVLLWRRDAPRVAALHCGWRGVVGGLVGRAITALGAPAATGIAVGAGIGPCCFEVASDVRDRFVASFGEAVTHGRHVDLAAAVTVDAERAGVPAASVHRLGGCTVCEPERWFSYRRDGAHTGRQAGVIWAV